MTILLSSQADSSHQEISSDRKFNKKENIGDHIKDPQGLESRSRGSVAWQLYCIPTEPTPASHTQHSLAQQQEEEEGRSGETQEGVQLLAT